MKRSAAKSRSSKANTSTRTSANQAASKTSVRKPRPAKTKTSRQKKSAPQTVDQYLAAVPKPARSALDQIRAAIRSVVPPEATEIISYKIPAFKHKKVLVWYAAFSNHCSLFPTAALIEAFKNELKDFSTSKGTIHFPLDKPMPVELIKKMVKARLGRSG
ncbi:MAG TPA: DUF1801 domain-containing protein [Candidatus Angelobacter sp.]|nr:DUF1801 domain-containing protein [Candidatus Angelobacter sp.]